MFVYAIGAFDALDEVLRAVKIGISKKPCDRLESLQSQNPDFLVLLGSQSFRNASVVEKAIHELLSSEHLGRGWYKPSPFVLARVLWIASPLSLRDKHWCDSDSPMVDYIKDCLFLPSGMSEGDIWS